MAILTFKRCNDSLGARDYCSPRSYRPVPDRLYRKAKESTPFVVVRDDYLPHDFLLALFQKPFHERLGSSPKTVRRESHE